MKPFVAVTVLVAASLSAASAAGTQQQQTARGSQAGRGQGPLLGGSLQSPSGSSGSGSPSWPGASLNGQVSGGFPSGPFWPVQSGLGGVQGGAFGAASSGSPSLSPSGGASRPGSGAVGSVQSQGFPSGRFVFGSYPGASGFVYYPRPIYYPSYGNGAVWVQYPAYGGNLWGFNGNGYGYGGVFPAGFGQVSYGGFGGPTFGLSGQQAPAGQSPTSLGGSRASGAGGSRLQRPAARQ